MTPKTDQDDEEFQLAFFRTGVAAQIGFIFAALVGVGMVCLTQPQMGAAPAVFGHLAQLTRHLYGF